MAENYVSYPDFLPAPSENFSGTLSTPTQTTQFTSGKIRRRKIGRTSVKRVSLEWFFTPDEYDMFEVFYNNTLNAGCDKFEIQMCSGGDLQTGPHVVQFVGDPSFNHEECNWRVTADCIIYPYPKGEDGLLLPYYLGGPVEDFLEIMNIYYDRNYIQ
ncbi:hypothetical protein IBZ20DMU1_19 [Acinetobacter phage DMU1]|nr:hypothetical protein IBZ20DMU1_19 [Acinetobacter phage DMU1]